MAIRPRTSNERLGSTQSRLSPPPRALLQQRPPKLPRGGRGERTTRELVTVFMICKWATSVTDSPGVQRRNSRALRANTDVNSLIV